MTRRPAVRRFDPSRIRHREPGVLGELEQLSSQALALVARMERQLRAIDADRNRALKAQQDTWSQQYELDQTCR